MGLQTFQILFDNPQGVYYCGQNLSGRVVISVDAPKKVRAIMLKIKGFAEVRWTEQHHHNTGTHAGHNHHDIHHHNNSGTHTETYHSEEVYLENSNILFGAGGDQTLPQGEHVYPFNYILPANTPSSFEGKHGHVRYTVKVTIDRPWKFDHEAKAAFTVICPLDLNATPALMNPIQRSKAKTFCCWCCVSAPMQATLILPRGGGVSGENLLNTLEVENHSNVKITLVKLKFIKTITYRAQGHVKHEEVTISEKDLGRVEARASHTWSEEPLPIPALPPSNLTNCGIIDVEYSLKAILIPAGAHMGINITAPVVVGTIPFHSNFGNFSSAPSAPPLGWNLAPSAPSAPFAPEAQGLPNYPDLPPPSFQEAVTGGQSMTEKDENQYMHGDKTYTPRYPVYMRIPPPQ